jgi:23S rRNA (uracil1939-C5)-methyltransferase
MKDASNEPDPPHIGARLTTTVESLASGGDGIARPEGFTLFIPHTAPGDVVDVEVVRTAKHYGRARLLAVRTPGPDRIPTSCPLAEGCAGCQLQHLRYPAQLEAKRTFVRDGLERIGRLHGVEVLPTLGMADPWRYRNKGEFTAAVLDGRLRLGYHGEDHQFLPLPDCPIQHPLSIEILHAVEEVGTELRLPLAQLITRVSPSTGEALAILVCWEWADTLPAAAEALQARVPALAGVLWSRVHGKSVVRRSLAEPLAGNTRLTQHLRTWEYTVSAESFFQVNTAQAEQLVELALAYAGDLGGRTVADGYCGVGTFLIPLAQHAARALGVEEHPTALRDAERNVSHYGLSDVRLYEGRVETIFPRLARKGRQVDVAVLDPPRKGAGQAVLESLTALDASRVVLISCDPATLGRDAGDLAALGYKLQRVQPVDMFPQTWHVEAIALATR